MGYVMQLVLKITKNRFINQLNNQFLSEYITDYLIFNNPHCSINGLRSSQFRVTDINFYHCDSKNQCPQTSQSCKTHTGINGNVLMSITFKTDSHIILSLYNTQYRCLLTTITLIVNFTMDHNCDNDTLQLVLDRVVGVQFANYRRYCTKSTTVEYYDNYEFCHVRVEVKTGNNFRVFRK